MVYALADRGARLLIERDGIAFANVEWSRKNHAAGRPFIEHQLEIMDFSVALQSAVRTRPDLRVMHADELAAGCPDQTLNPRSSFALRARLTHAGIAHDVGVVPDLVFGLAFADGTRRCFMVEIDRGTMPVTRTDLAQTSFERKMRGYLTAYAAKQHEKKFGWKAFRVLTITIDATRKQTMLEALAKLRVPHSPGPSLFWFLTRQEVTAFDLLMQPWHDGNERQVRLI